MYWIFMYSFRFDYMPVTYSLSNIRDILNSVRNSLTSKKYYVEIMEKSIFSNLKANLFENFDLF